MIIIELDIGQKVRSRLDNEIGRVIEQTIDENIYLVKFKSGRKYIFISDLDILKR